MAFIAFMASQACCCRLWVTLPRRHQPSGIKFNCFSLSHVRSMPAESFTFTCIFRSSSHPKPHVPRRAFIAFIAFMGAMTTGAGSVRERDVAREILEVAAAK